MGVQPHPPTISDVEIPDLKESLGLNIPYILYIIDQKFHFLKRCQKKGQGPSSRPPLIPAMPERIHSAPPPPQPPPKCKVAENVNHKMIQVLLKLAFLS